MLYSVQPQVAGDYTRLRSVMILLFISISHDAISFAYDLVAVDLVAMISSLKMLKFLTVNFSFLHLINASYHHTFSSEYTPAFYI